MELNGAKYYYVFNLQGDVVALTDATGAKVVEYLYDSWGRLVSTTGIMASTVGVKNPYRYRGYRYDSETGLYYLQSRYYDASMRRFINADVYVDTGNSVLSTNMFAYCENNPVNMVDPNGEYATGALVLPATSALSGALAKLMASISVSMASIKAAMVTSAIIVACVAATAVAIAGIIYAVNKVKALYASAASAISAVKSRIGKGGVNSKKLKKHTVYVIVRKNTKDVVYVGRTLNYSSRMVAHKRGSKFNGFKTYTMMPIATNLSLSQARALEQAIISAYTIDTLKNMINSISPKKWSNFKTEFRQMQTLMQSWVDPE